MAERPDLCEAWHHFVDTVQRELGLQKLLNWASEKLGKLL